MRVADNETQGLRPALENSSTIVHARALKWLSQVLQQRLQTKTPPRTSTLVLKFGNVFLSGSYAARVTAMGDTRWSRATKSVRVNFHSNGFAKVS